MNDSHGHADRSDVSGTLITESLRAGTRLQVGLTVDRIDRVEPGDTTAEQPPVWTLLDFHVGQDAAPALAAALQAALADGPWYCDFHSDLESWVVFSGRTFRYPRGDAAGRARAAAHGRAVGVPEPQLDWAR